MITNIERFVAARVEGVRKMDLIRPLVILVIVSTLTYGLTPFASI